MRFQKLRIAWSRGHEHSGEMIEAMKRGKGGVDLEKAKEAGSNDDLDKNLLHNAVGKEGEGQVEKVRIDRHFNISVLRLTNAVRIPTLLVLGTQHRGS